MHSSRRKRVRRTLSYASDMVMATKLPARVPLANVGCWTIRSSGRVICVIVLVVVSFMAQVGVSKDSCQVMPYLPAVILSTDSVLANLRPVKWC